MQAFRSKAKNPHRSNCTCPMNSDDMSLHECHFLDVPIPSNSAVDMVTKSTQSKLAIEQPWKWDPPIDPVVAWSAKLRQLQQNQTDPSCGPGVFATSPKFQLRIGHLCAAGHDIEKCALGRRQEKGPKKSAGKKNENHVDTVNILLTSWILSKWLSCSEHLAEFFAWVWSQRIKKVTCLLTGGEAKIAIEAQPQTMEMAILWPCVSEEVLVQPHGHRRGP